MKPLMIYDGHCGFCRRWIERWKEMTGEAVDYAPSQEVAGRFPEIPSAEFDNAVIFVEADGSIKKAAHAVFAVLRYANYLKGLEKAYNKIPLFASLSEWAYAQVARNRFFFQF